MIVKITLVLMLVFFLTTGMTCYVAHKIIEEREEKIEEVLKPK